MKIAIPTVDGKLCMHFGHCREFAVVDADPDTGTVSACQMLEPPPHEPGVLPRWLHEQGVDVVIAGGMGHRAMKLFAQHGVDVVVGAPSAAPEDVAAAYISGSLERGTNVCAH